MAVRRRRGITLILILVALVALWGLYWYAAHAIADAAIDRGLAAGATGGRSAECSGRRSGGFPFHIDLACTSARFADGGNGPSAAIDGLALSAPLYWPGRVAATASGPLQLDVPENAIALTARWQSAASTADTGIDGLKRLAATLQGVEVEGPLALPGLDVKGLGIADLAIAGAPASGEADGYRLTLALSELRLDAGDGRALPVIDLAGNVTALGLGRSLGFDPKSTLLAWLRAGAAMKIGQMKFTAGGFTGEARGELRLSDERKLSGRLTLRFRNLDQLPDLVEAFRPGSREDVEQVARIIAVTTKKVEDADGPARETTVNFRKGVVSVGIIPVGVLPALDF